ncbi:hypothetical protein [Labilithrix luteola]|uniref:hypothetical protein n=1 Tax=Labilithrix luteola TaxID=1391654 RepID=UPI0011BA7C19|nr:hypothetical protein [Labilithrix luteola]
MSKRTAIWRCAWILFVAACGGTTAATSDTDAGRSATDNACVDFDPSTYDRSCQTDNDCVPIFAGTLCPGYGCWCPTGTVSAADEVRYQAALASVPRGSNPCFCPPMGTGRCIVGQCVWCPINHTTNEFVCPVDGG